MPRVHHVKKARKDNPVAKRGESYYWWKFRYGGKQYSKTPPKQSQLTQSPYYATLYDLQDEIAEADCCDEDTLEALKERVSEALRELGQECQEKVDNMPDSLQHSPTGELLQERADACDSAADEVENIETFDDDEPQEQEYEEECPECEGRGHAEDDEFDHCDECNGSGEIINESDFDAEFQDWEHREDEHYENAKNEIEEAVSNCFC